MGRYSKYVTSERFIGSTISRDIKFKFIPKQYVKCPSDKIWVTQDQIDLSKLKDFKEQSLTIKLHMKIKKKKDWYMYYDLNFCNTYSFDNLIVTILFFKTTERFLIQYNPSQSTYQFLLAVNRFIKGSSSLTPTSRVHLNVDLYYPPKTAVNLVDIKRKQAFKKEDKEVLKSGYINQGSLYGGKNRSVIVYDNYACDSNRLKGTTRVEIRFNKKRECPICTLEQLPNLQDHNSLFQNIRLPATLSLVQCKANEYEALKDYVNFFFKNNFCHAKTVEKAFKNKQRKYRDAFRRWQNKRVVRYVNLDNAFKRNLKIYLNRPIQESELNLLKKFYVE